MSLTKTAPQVQIFLDNICFKAKNGSENSVFVEKNRKFCSKAIFRGCKFIENLFRDGLEPGQDRIRFW